MIVSLILNRIEDEEKYDFMRQLVCCIYVVELWIEQGKCLQEGLRKGKVARADAGESAAPVVTPRRGVARNTDNRGREC